MAAVLIHWFRTDLRLHDHPALLRSVARCRREGLSLLPVAWHSPSVPVDTRWGFARVGEHRRAFRHQALTGLAKRLRGLGSDLWVLDDATAGPLLELARRAGATHVVAEAIDAPEELAEVRTLQDGGLHVDTVWQSSLLAPDDLPWLQGRVPDVFTAFRQGVERAQVQVPAPLPAPTQLPPWPDHLERPPSPCAPPLSAGATDERSSFPYGSSAWQGHEAAALDHLQRYLAAGHPHRYKATRNALSGRDFASHWSPWLAVGALSARQAMAALRAFENERGANEGSYWLWFELLWRDHFRFVMRQHGARLFAARGLSGDRTPQACRHDPRAFARWCEGRTGQPLADAAMRELRHTGYLSNRLRQIVASALIHELGGDWRAGASWFEHCLIDFDVHSNQGNWAYIAGVGTDPRGGRRFNLDKQTQDHDPDGSYRRRWTA
ncbi:MAG TPA: DASH family cryptochrome [Hydrogenophaga sp.]|uniref:DASH family cryptochrome n=1 Tax=Hydrogenophaga sp. TaxID=1904254 RepID=UPI002CFC699F|nr:DASH family cryptochrome [Hydrogenophaga sp.]HMN94522.1 DASH family cryptochrome [Hydrogenophaga sp.]HMP11285.1 DASH family cryptochrome [Hydrogenophaga sp.]